jgi:hypothetical protein
VKIVRVFPRRTKASPDDALAFFGPPGLFPPTADEVHISVAFSWDMIEAERLAGEWKNVAPVKIGGPATGAASGEFIPGRYLRRGLVITSRGCPNKCWFCSVHRREPKLTELPITDGWNVMDDNLLACSESHIRAVFGMLDCQGRRPTFSGGLEARLLKPWQAEWLAARRAQIYFAYDTPDDREPLTEAVKLCLQSGYTVSGHRIGCYVLIGYPGDSIERAEIRLTFTAKTGAMPYAMLYRDQDGARPSLAWRRFQREWLRPKIVGQKMADVERDEERGE